MRTVIVCTVMLIARCGLSANEIAISGTVDGDAEGIIVSVMDVKSASVLEHVVIGSSGEYELTLTIPEGTSYDEYEVVPYSHEYLVSPRSRRLSGTEKNQNNMNFSLLEPNVVEGVVVNRLGEPIVGAFIQIKDTKTGRRVMPGEGSVMTDDGGRFRLSVPDGAYLLGVRDHGIERRIAISGGDRRMIYMSVDSGLSELMGAVYGEDGEAVEGASVILRRIDAMSEARKRVTSRPTSYAGEYRIDGVMPGKYSIRVIHPEYGGMTTDVEEIDLKSSGTKKMNLVVGLVDYDERRRRKVQEAETLSNGIEAAFDYLREVDNQQTNGPSEGEGSDDY